MQPVSILVVGKAILVLDVIIKWETIKRVIGIISSDDTFRHIKDYHEAIKCCLHS